MHRFISLLPVIVTLLSALAMMMHGPIMQPPHYHDFADKRMLWGVPNGADVLSNLGFAFAGGWGLALLWNRRRHAALSAGWPGYCLFLLALIATAAGSSYYHLAPDNIRLVWDRIPIALACAGLLAATYAELTLKYRASHCLMLLVPAAIASVAWWYVTGENGQGDLRPYLFLQCLPMVLIPLWQWIYHAPISDRRLFGCAILLYIAAKAAEVYDHALLDVMTYMSGHTLKHLLATAAASVIIVALVRRTDTNIGQ